MFEEFDCVGTGYNKSEHDGINFRWVGGNYLLLYFLSPARIGKNITEPNAMIVYGPGETRDYGSCGGFMNSYVTFVLSEDSFNKFNIKTGKVFYPDSWSSINKLLKKINDEKINERPCGNYALLGLTLQLLSEVGRGQNAPSGIRADKEQQRRRRFEEIREEYLSNLADPPDINEIIASEFFSTSQFYRLYKRFFGTSPNEDLLRARMEYAKDLMIKTNLSTAEIAVLAGFKTPLNLYRCFGRRSDCSVKQWKQRAKKEEVKEEAAENQAAPLIM